MISVALSMALMIVDAYNRQACPYALSFMVDGREAGCVRKKDGYRCFAGLSPGPHEIAVVSRLYERLEFMALIPEQGYLEKAVYLLPGAKYPFERRVSMLSARITRGALPLPGARVYAASRGPWLKLGKEAEPGVSELCVFTKYRQALFPGYYIIDKTEAAWLCAADGKAGLERPLERAHAKGASLIPAAEYAADADGFINAYFDSQSALIYSPDMGGCVEISLEAGENRYDIDVLKGDKH